MKTLSDLEALHKELHHPFTNAYEGLIMTLENAYIKSRMSQIEELLKEWNDDAKKSIISELSKRLRNDGIKDFGENEIWDLFK